VALTTREKWWIIWVKAQKKNLQLLCALSYQLTIVISFWYPIIGISKKLQENTVKMQPIAVNDASKQDVAIKLKFTLKF